MSEIGADAIRKLSEQISAFGKSGSVSIASGVVQSAGKEVTVLIDGAEVPTPVSDCLVAVNVGDTVRVEIDGGKAVVTGNSTTPPTGDAEAVKAGKAAVEALDGQKRIEQHFWADEKGAHVADGDGNELLTQGRGLRFLKDGAELLSLGLIDKDEKKPESDYSTYPQLAGGSCIYMVPKGTTVAKGETVCMVCLQNGMWYYVLFTAPFDMVGGDDDTCAWARWDFGYEWVYVTPAGGDVSDSVEVSAQVTNADVNALGLNGDLDVAGTVRAGLVDAALVRCEGEKVNGDSRVLGSVWASGTGRFDGGMSVMGGCNMSGGLNVSGTVRGIDTAFGYSTVTLIDSESVAANGYKGGTATGTVAGGPWYPLAVCGWYSSTRYYVPVRLQISSQASNSVGIDWLIYNPHSKAISSKFTVRILWVRMAA